MSDWECGVFFFLFLPFLLPSFLFLLASRLFDLRIAFTLFFPDEVFCWYGYTVFNFFMRDAMAFSYGVLPDAPWCLHVLLVL